MKLIPIREVLLFTDTNPEGWFYLPPDDSGWTIDTLGVFSLDSANFAPESDEYLPKQAIEDGWIEVLDNGSIEEVVANVNLQLETPTITDLFNAFVFYFKNDSFISF